MSLRQALGGDTRRLHELLEEFFDRENVVVLLFDGDRTVNYMSGFCLSPCQQELMALEIERMVRDAGTTGVSAGTGRRNQRENGSDSGRGSRLREHRVVTATGLTAVWLTEEVRVFGLVMLLTAIVASLLVLYFDWRRRMMRHLRAEPDAHQDLEKAA